MTQLIIGIVLGAVLTGSFGLAGGLYNHDGSPGGPSGSIQQFDYFRNRQQQLDIQHLRREADRQRLDRRVNPCAK